MDGRDRGFGGRLGAKEREKRERLMRAARHREIDAVVVWRLDRWGRSLVDLVTTLGELGVGFVSLTEALDLTTPTGRAMAGLLAVFAEFERDILRERIKSGIAQARAEGKPHGRPRSASLQEERVRKMYEVGMSKLEIVRQILRLVSLRAMRSSSWRWRWCLRFSSALAVSLTLERLLGSRATLYVLVGVTSTALAFLVWSATTLRVESAVCKRGAEVF